MIPAANTSEDVCPTYEAARNGVSSDQYPAIPSKRWYWTALKYFAELYLPKCKELPQNPKSVIVLTGGNLGGTIMTLPLLESVRKKYPQAHLAVVCNNEASRSIVKAFGESDSLHIIRNNTLRSFSVFRAYLVTLKNLASLGAEIVISNHNAATTEQFTIPLRVKARIGHVGASVSNRELIWGSIWNFPVPVAAEDNWFDSYLNLASVFDGGLASPPLITPGAELSRWANQTLSRLVPASAKRVVALQLGVWSVQSWKQWPIESLAELVERAWQEQRIVCLALGDAGGKRSFIDLKNLLSSGTEILNFVGECSIEESAALLSACDASICNDSGLMHLSGALGVPTVALFGMTDAKVTWCYGESEHRLVSRDDCKPCYHLDMDQPNRCAHRKCLTALEVEKVYSALQSLLTRGSSTAQANFKTSNY